MGEGGARSSYLLLLQELKCCLPTAAAKEALDRGFANIRLAIPHVLTGKEVDTTKKEQSKYWEEWSKCSDGRQWGRERNSLDLHRSFVCSDNKKIAIPTSGMTYIYSEVIQKQKLCKEILDALTYSESSGAILGHSFWKLEVTPTGSFMSRKGQKIDESSKSFSLASTLEFIWSNGKI